MITRVSIIVLAIFAAVPTEAMELSIADGDTLTVNGVTYALEGIQAPQTDQTCLDDKGAAWTCGIEARDRLRDYIGGRDVECIDRGSDSIYRRRRVGDCRVSGEAVSISQWMVQE